MDVNILIVKKKKKIVNFFKNLRIYKYNKECEKLNKNK